MIWTRTPLAGVLLTAGSAVALLVPLAAPAQADSDLRAQMLPTASHTTASGHAEADPGSTSRRTFEIRLVGLRRLHGRLLTVRVHGAFVGRMQVGTRGRAHLERHTSVPMRAGNVVRVRTAGGTLVSRGTLQRHSDTHEHHD